MGVVPPRRPVRHVQARVGDLRDRDHELQLRDRVLRVGEDRPVLDRVLVAVLEAPAEQTEQLDVDFLETVAQLGEPLGGVDVPGDGVPLRPPPLEEPAERHLLPASSSKQGDMGSMHRSPIPTSDATRLSSGA